MKSKINEDSKLRAKALSKKLILFLAVVAVASSATAQINKGRMMLGASFNTQNNSNSYSQSDSSNHVMNNQTSKNNLVSASVRYGYFIADGWMVGILGNYSKSYNETKIEYFAPYYTPSTSLSSTTYPSLGGGVFTRYYHMIGQSRFAWFGELALSAGGGKNKTTYETNGVPVPNNASGKSVYYSASVKPGITYFLNQVLAVEATFGNVGYNYAKTETGTKGSTPYYSNVSSGFNSHLNFSLNNVSLGINFYFGGKKA